MTGSLTYDYCLRQMTGTDVLRVTATMSCLATLQVYPPPFSEARGSIMKIKHVSVLLQTILNVYTNPEEKMYTSIVTRLPNGRVMVKYAYVMLIT